MDDLDKKIIAELIKNSRIPVTKLSKKVKRSREVINYRLQKLKKEKIILDFVTEINSKKLGFIGAAVFIKIRAQKEKEFKSFLQRCNFISWVAELSGVWSFGLSIYAKNNEDLDEKFLLLYNKFKDEIIDHRFTLHRKSTFFYEKYLNIRDDKSQKKNQKKLSTYKLDTRDKVILKELSKNSRIETLQIAKKLNITSVAVAKRIKQLEKANFIEKYSVFLDLQKIGLLQYSIFLRNKNIHQKKKLLNYAKQHRNVSFIAEYIGDPFLELGIIIKNPYDLRVILQEIEESFPDNRVFEISLFQKEFFSIGVPDCIFE